LYLTVGAYRKITNGASESMSCVLNSIRIPVTHKSILQENTIVANLNDIFIAHLVYHMWQREKIHNRREYWATLGYAVLFVMMIYLARIKRKISPIILAPSSSCTTFELEHCSSEWWWPKISPFILETPFMHISCRSDTWFMIQLVPTVDVTCCSGDGHPQLQKLVKISATIVQHCLECENCKSKRKEYKMCKLKQLTTYFQLLNVLFYCVSSILFLSF
jgi:hypothetical protein